MIASFMNPPSLRRYGVVDHATSSESAGEAEIVRFTCILEKNPIARIEITPRKRPRPISECLHQSENRTNRGTGHQHGRRSCQRSGRWIGARQESEGKMW
jgi:hypothetical protein